MTSAVSKSVSVVNINFVRHHTTMVLGEHLPRLWIRTPDLPALSPRVLSIKPPRWYIISFGSTSISPRVVYRWWLSCLYIGRFPSRHLCSPKLLIRLAFLKMQPRGRRIRKDINRGSNSNRFLFGRIDRYRQPLRVCSTYRISTTQPCKRSCTFFLTNSFDL